MEKDRGIEMKWGEFKRLLEKEGVKEEDEIWYIDISFNDEITFFKDGRLGWAIG